jgi:hypothetical protein
MKARTAIRVCIVMALLITLLAGASAGVAFHVQNNWPYIAMGVGTGVITFFGLLILGHNGEERWKITGESMRTAIAGAIVVEYLALVGTVAFFVQGQMPPIAQTMITNFTTIVGVVIAFYFGASAFVQVEREKHAKSNDKPGNAAAIVPK